MEIPISWIINFIHKYPNAIIDFIVNEYRVFSDTILKIFSPAIMYFANHPQLKYIILVALTLIFSVLAAVFITKGLLLKNVVLNKWRETKKYLLIGGKQEEITFNIPDVPDAPDESKEDSIKINIFGKTGEETSFQNPDTSAPLIDKEEREAILNQINLQGKEYISRLENEITTLRGAFNANASSMNIVRNYYESNQLAFPGANELAERERLLALIKRLSESNEMFKEMLANRGGASRDLSSQMTSLFDSRDEVTKLQKKIRQLEDEAARNVKLDNVKTDDKGRLEETPGSNESEVNFLKMIRELSRDNIELKGLLKAADMDQEKLREEIEKFIQSQRENSYMKEELSDLKQQLEKLKRSDVQMTDETQRLMEEKDSERERGDKFLKSFKDIASKNEELQRLVKAADMDAENLKREIDSFVKANRENVELKRKNEELELEIRHLKDESRSMLDETQSMSSVLQHNNDLKDKINRLEKLIAEFEINKSTLDNEAETYQRDMDKATKATQENKDLKFRLNEAEIEVTKLQNIIKQNEGNYAKMSEEVNSLMHIDSESKKISEKSNVYKRQIEELQATIASLEKEQDTLLIEVEQGVTAQRDNAKLLQDNDTLKQENDSMTFEIEKLLKETQGFSAELSSLTQKYTLQKEKTQDAKERYEQVESIIEQERLASNKKIKELTKNAEEEMNTMLQELDKFAQVERQNKALQAELDELKKHNNKAA